MANIINLNNISNTYLERSRLFVSYMTDIKKIPLLSRDEEKTLLKQYQNSSSKEEKIKIRNKLLKHNQLFIASTAKRYANNDIDAFLDLIGEINLGFIEAIDTYDLTKDTKLISWASFYLRRAANSYNMRRSMVRIPYNDILYTHYADARNTLMQEKGREVTNEEIFEYLTQVKNLPITDVNDVRQLQVNSIDETYQDEENFNTVLTEYNTATSSLNDSEKKSDEYDKKIMINLAMNCLNEQEREIIQLSYGLNGEAFENTLETIASKFDCSSERIRQIRLKALKKLEKKLIKYSKKESF